jgi:hypothetical protein
LPTFDRPTSTTSSSTVGGSNIGVYTGWCLKSV